MKKHFILFCFSIISFLSINSCCLKSGDLLGTRLITNEMKSKIPYQGDEVINMIHSEGYEFTANTSFHSTLYADQNHCEDYYEYEMVDINFYSDLPNLFIELSLNAYDSEEEEDFFINRIPYIKINNYFFHKEQEPLNSFVVNGNNYNNVYRYFTEQQGSNITELFYNYEIGILKINYRDESYVQINP